MYTVIIYEHLAERVYIYSSNKILFLEFTILLFLQLPVFKDQIALFTLFTVSSLLS